MKQPIAVGKLGKAMQLSNTLQWVICADASRHCNDIILVIDLELVCRRHQHRMFHMVIQHGN
jgi:hypothetical protein